MNDQTVTYNLHRTDRRVLSKNVALLDLAMQHRGQKLPQFFDHFASSAKQHLGVQAVSIWHHDPVNRKLLHAATSGAPAPIPNILDVRSSHSGRCIESKLPLPSMIMDQFYDKHSDQHASLDGVRPFTRMSSIPVLNSVNRNQVLCVINLLDIRDITVQHSDLVAVGRICAEHYEEVLHETCYTMANLIEREFIQRSDSAEQLYGVLAKKVRNTIDCDLVVLWQKEQHGHLRFGAMDAEVYDLLRESIDSIFSEAEKCVATNRERLHFAGRVTKKSTYENIATCAIPIRDLRGEAVGAMVCLKDCNSGKGGHTGFNYGDIAICEALGQSFAVFSQLLAGETERLESLARLGHELKAPVSGMRAALELVRAELSKLSSFRFSHDFLSDLDSYTKTFADLLKDFETGSLLQFRMDLELKPSRMVSDIVAPATRAADEEAGKRGFPHGRITRPTVSTAPRLMLDSARMQQVVMNLFQNAIKYADDNEKFRFRVIVDFAFEGGFFSLKVRDFGIGVPKGSEKRIFEFGYRAPNAIAKHANGLGFGLSIARKIVRAHGGELEYRRPTDGLGSEFVILLPSNLRVGSDGN